MNIPASMKKDKRPEMVKQRKVVSGFIVLKFEKILRHFQGKQQDQFLLSWCSLDNWHVQSKRVLHLIHGYKIRDHEQWWKTAKGGEKKSLFF